MDTALATFQPSGMSSDFNEKSDRLCANSSTSLLSHSFWICVWSQWPIANWWSHPVVFTCASRSINFGSPSLTSKSTSVEMSALRSGRLPPSVILSVDVSTPSYASRIIWLWVGFFSLLPFFLPLYVEVWAWMFFYRMCVCSVLQWVSTPLCEL